MSDSLPAPILHLDNHLLAVLKPAGVPVQADSSGDPSLQEQWQAWLKKEYHKPGRVFLAIVHRLDRPVSGVLLFARTSKAASRLSAAWREGGVRKEYLGLGRGAVAEDSGELEQWLLKDRARNRVRVVPPGTPEARPARTRWKILARLPAQGLLFHLEPLTGRSHQLRLVCQTLGAPLLGDLKYGARAPRPDRSIALHAWKLHFPHPVLPDPLTLVAPPPPGLEPPEGN